MSNTISRSPSQSTVQVNPTRSTENLTPASTERTPSTRTSQGLPSVFGSNRYETASVSTQTNPSAGTVGIHRSIGSNTTLAQTGTLSATTATQTAAATAQTSAGDPTGILAGMSPGGASTATARQDKIKQGGVDASRQLAQNDADRVMKHKSTFEQVGKKFDIPPAILAGIASRETRGGALLDKQGYGQYDPNGYGLLQVDKNNHTLQGTNNPASLAHMEQAASIFAGNYNEIKEKHPDWTPEQQLQAAVASYNKGGASFRKMTNPPANFDRGTTGGDYSNDVLARAQYFASQW